MTLKNKTNQKIISTLLILAILAPTFLFLSIPKRANAQLGVCVTVGELGEPAPCASEDTSWLVKFFTGATSVSAAESAAFDAHQWAAYLLRQVLMAVARKVLADMTRATTNWINTGFHGEPLFLERPGAFFTDIAKFEIKDLVNTIGYDSNKYPFGKDFALNVIGSYKNTFEANSQYSLSKVINDPVLLNNYRNDFSVGGWNGFLINTQYPQNNYIGYQILASNELARRLAGTEQNKASIVKDTLAQGMGFLSPQVCTGPNAAQYNNLQNEFHINSFKCSVPPPTPTNCDSITDPNKKIDCGIQNSFESTKQEQACAFEKAEWAKKNVCQGGLVNTTPGSVVGNQIMKALTSGTFDQTSLAAAMGNSLAAIFDALLNKFISSGLSALTSRSNPPAPTDNFDYYGHTLGSPTPTTSGTGTGFDWNAPDQIITLSTFKQDVQNAINNGNKELKLIDSNDVTTPGILQELNKTFPKTQELDVCLPGPNIGWETRIDNESQRVGAGLQAKMNNPDQAKAAAAATAFNELAFAVNSFKDWLDNKIHTELPSSGSYLDAVNSVKNSNKQLGNLSDRKNTIHDTLIQLASIKTQLDAITTQPASGSPEEATMVRLKQQMDGLLADISNTTTVNDMQSALDTAKAKLANLDTLITKCTTERTAKGWTVPGGETSSFNSKTEKETFCSLPIVGGYSHKSFVNSGAVTYPEIPLVNASNVYPDSSGVVDNQIDIAISCDTIFRTNITDYKPNNPVP